MEGAHHEQIYLGRIENWKDVGARNGPLVLITLRVADRIAHLEDDATTRRVVARCECDLPERGRRGSRCGALGVTTVSRCSSFQIAAAPLAESPPSSSPTFSASAAGENGFSTNATSRPGRIRSASGVSAYPDM
jgi:hypothetical protein